MIEERPSNQQGWTYLTEDEPMNWAVESSPAIRVELRGHHLQHLKDIDSEAVQGENHPQILEGSLIHVDEVIFTFPGCVIDTFD
ncbi:hypothetical protein CR513_58743, partial [Mucuna pruriens]